MPKLNAQLEFIDHALFEATTLVFATLIDERPDRENHLSHLIIKRADRDGLVKSIDNLFGSKLAAKDQNYTVSAAWLLKEFLSKKGYKLADDAW